MHLEYLMEYSYALQTITVTKFAAHVAGKA
jgi:hypothetical protein